MTPQSSILPEDRAHSLFLTLKIKDGAKTPRIIAHCAQLPQAIEKMRGRFGAEITGTLGWGYAVCRLILGADRIPPGMRDFDGITDKAPATGGDLLLHINSDRADLNYELVANLLAPLDDELAPLDETAAARYLDSRDLTGFIDGTENPEGESARAEAALIPGGDYRGGSFAFVQRYEHNLPRWSPLDDAEKEHTIGRTMADSVELENKKETAHISRVVIEENGKELEIVRHSMPYFSVSGKKGLVFLAYTRRLDIIEKMLNRMFGQTSDGLSDQLMEYTKPVSGAMFFAPSLETLRRA